MPVDIKSLNRRFFDEVLHKGDLDAIDELIAADVVEHNPFPGTAAGREGVRQSIRMLRDAFPDLHFDIESEIAENDTVATVGTFTGTHSAEFFGVPPTGKRVTATFMDVTRAREGRFVEHWGLFDVTAMLSQLGVMPTPSAS